MCVGCRGNSRSLKSLEMSAKTMATSGQWTIPSDPGQKFQRGGVEPPRAVARVKPEAAVIAKANVDGSIALVFNQHPPVPKRPQSDRRGEVLLPSVCP